MKKKKKSLIEIFRDYLRKRHIKKGEEFNGKY